MTCASANSVGNSGGRPLVPPTMLNGPSPKSAPSRPVVSRTTILRNALEVFGRDTVHAALWLLGAYSRMGSYEPARPSRDKNTSTTAEGSGVEFHCRLVEVPTVSEGLGAVT